MTRRYLIAVVALFAALVFGVVLLWQHNRGLGAERERLARQLARVRHDLTEVQSRASRSVAAAPAPTFNPAPGLRERVHAYRVEHGEEKRSRLPPAPSGPHGEIFSELMGDPAYVGALSRQLRWVAECLYARALNRLSLAPEVRSQVIKKLGDQLMIENEVEYVAEEGGIAADDHDRRIQALRSKLEGEISLEIKALLGPAAYDQFMQAPRVIGSQETVEAFATRLSYSEEPLQPVQADQLNALLHSRRGWQPGKRSTSKGIDVITDAQLATAATFLSPGQVAQLREFREEQQASITR